MRDKYNKNIDGIIIKVDIVDNEIYNSQYNWEYFKLYDRQDLSDEELAWLNKQARLQQKFLLIKKKKISVLDTEYSNYLRLLLSKDRERKILLKEQDASSLINTLNKSIEILKKNLQIEEIKEVWEFIYEVITNALYINEHFIWKYKMYINFTDNIVKIYSLDHNEKYPHPHVSSNNDPCWGEFLRWIINNSMSIMDMEQVVYSAIALLESYNDDSAYQPLGKWLDSIN